MVSNTLHLVLKNRRLELGGGKTYEYTYGVVILLGALGVKGIWKTKNVTEVFENWNSVYYSFSDTINNRQLSGVSLYAFSDTFIVSMRGHERLIKDPIEFVELICNAIIPPFLRSMQYDFFFRGVISMGWFSDSSRMLIGPAVDEAATYYEAADWVGISISPSTHAILRNYTSYRRSNLITDYQIPQKKKNGVLASAVKWIKYDYSNECYRILHNKAAENLKTNHNAYMKYKNTLDFYTRCLGIQ